MCLAAMQFFRRNMISSLKLALRKFQISQDFRSETELTTSFSVHHSRTRNSNCPNSSFFLFFMGLRYLAYTWAANAPAGALYNKVPIWINFKALSISPEDLFVRFWYWKWLVFHFKSEKSPTRNICSSSAPSRRLPLESRLTRIVCFLARLRKQIDDVLVFVYMADNSLW